MLIRRLRVALPVVIGVIFLGLVVAVSYNALTASPVRPANSDEPIRLVNPRFVGRDDKGRAFVLTAISATRDPKEYQRVILDKPALVLDEGAQDAMRVNSTSGIYHEDTRKLELSGGVQLSGPKGAFQTATSLFDTKSGELVGSGPIQGAGDLGEITAKSYGVYDKGARMVFTGGVHTHIVKK
jgi:lipopolysaccharide export system protein LptC